jgi:hypothetical protein
MVCLACKPKKSKIVKNLKEKINYYEYLLDLKLDILQESELYEDDIYQLEELNLKHIDAVDNYLYEALSPETKKTLFKTAIIGTAAYVATNIINRIYQYFKMRMDRCENTFSGTVSSQGSFPIIGENLRKCRISVCNDAIKELKSSKSKCAGNESCLNAINKKIASFERAKERYEKYQDLNAIDAGRSNKRTIARRLLLPTNN